MKSIACFNLNSIFENRFRIVAVSMFLRLQVMIHCIQITAMCCYGWKSEEISDEILHTEHYNSEEGDSKAESASDGNQIEHGGDTEESEEGSGESVEDKESSATEIDEERWEKANNSSAADDTDDDDEESSSDEADKTAVSTSSGESNGDSSGSQMTYCRRQETKSPLTVEENKAR